MASPGPFRYLTSIALVAAIACSEKDPTAPESERRHSTLNDIPEDAGPYGVGHTTLEIVHTGSAGERRPIDVHVWYPISPAARVLAAPTEYRSRLFGIPLIPGTYDPVSFTIPARLASEGGAIDDHGAGFPLLIWSHGSTNDALDYAFTEEAIASHGYVVAAIQHTNNSQDDVLVDFFNQLAGRIVLPCFDGLPSPCSANVLEVNVKDRVLDVSALISKLEQINATHFSDRIDLTRIGVIGHSRGMTTAVAAVTGHSTFGVTADPRIDAILTMSSGGLSFISPALADVEVPVLMMVGASDENQPISIARSYFDRLVNAPRIFVVVRDAEHRSFDSALCARMQAAGAVRMANSRAIIEDRAIRSIVAHPVSGATLDYCSYHYFVDPVDIRPLVKTITGFDVSEANVPRTQDADEVSRLTVRLAVSFFEATLNNRGEDGLRFTRYLTPKYLLQHEPIVQSVETILSGKASCPAGHQCTH